jgi:hypothetical protein
MLKIYLVFSLNPYNCSYTYDKSFAKFEEAKEYVIKEKNNSVNNEFKWEEHENNYEYPGSGWYNGIHYAIIEETII